MSESLVEEGAFDCKHQAVQDWIHLVWILTFPEQPEVEGMGVVELHSYLDAEGLMEEVQGLLEGGVEVRV